MLHHLVTATRVVGLTYRLASSLTMIGLLGFGVYEFIKTQKRRR